MTALLRGSPIRTEQALEVLCPHCGKHGKHELAGRADADKRGKVLLLWEVAPRPGEYDAATLRHVRNGPPSEHTGVALPRPPGNVPFKDDPIPKFDGSDA